ncbi:MAG TPA: RAMP superfamily CRISPR-associated protein [Anaerolineae bacterium]|nr:RAMP superfamily CRISPR-associated protein [Anaerolineae bacterium]
MSAQWQNPRGVLERIVIEGTLKLETPANFSNGDAEGLTDIAVLRDPLKGMPLLSGASIAGALRSYLREHEKGYEWREDREAKNKSLAEVLFGHLDDSNQDAKASVLSWLMVDDALGRAPGFELRDEVAIDTKTRTAARGKKFDAELLQAGTEFDLRCELLLTEKNGSLLNALLVALTGFENGEIRLGRRKKRGYGQCQVESWNVRRHDLRKAKGLIAWLVDDQSGVQHVKRLADWQPISLKDTRAQMTLSAIFRLDGSLLIRSGSGTGNAPDMVHLHSRRDGGDVPILSGTSAAGAIRARAYRIANTLTRNEAKVKALIDCMFGPKIEKHTDQPRGSRVTVHETKIVNPPPPEKSLVQSRVKIDRFTGGAYPQALFSEQPVFANNETRVEIKLSLRKPVARDGASTEEIEKQERAFQAQVGLLLLVLKDLWTGDLPLGGESSVGRGRLQGERATVTCGGKAWTLIEKEVVSEKVGTQQKEAVIEITGTGTRDDLESYVTAFKTWAEQEGR